MGHYQICNLGTAACEAAGDLLLSLYCANLWYALLLSLLVIKVSCSCFFLAPPAITDKAAELY